MMDGDTVKLTTPVSKRNSLLKMLKKQLTREARSGSRPEQHAGGQYPGTTPYPGVTDSGHEGAAVYDVSAKVSRAASGAPSGLRDPISHPASTHRPPSSLSSRPPSSIASSSRPPSSLASGPPLSLEKRHVTFRGPPPGVPPGAVELSEIRHRESKPQPGKPTGHQPRPRDDQHFQRENTPARSSDRGARSNVNTVTGWRDYGATSASDSDDNPSASHNVVGKQRARAGPADTMTELTAQSRQAVDTGEHKPPGTRTVQYASEPWTIHDDTYFVYGPSFRAQRVTQRSTSRKTFREWWVEMWSPYGGFRRLSSVWINTALLLLFVANIMYMVAFVTNNWGILRAAQETPAEGAGVHNLDRRVSQPTPVSHNDTSLLSWLRDSRDSGRFVRDLGGGEDTKIPKVHGEHVVNLMKIHNKPSSYWSFGLWQCCRNTDGLCLGTRFSEFYSATRVFCVLSLFGLILSMAWLLGHSLERLLDYDVCTMSSLISLCYATTCFTTLGVVCFGVRWPVEFGHEFNGSEPHLSYSFYLALTTIPLTLTAAICMTVDLVKVRRREKSFYTEAELSFMDQAEDSIPTDNISRPRVQKKKRRTNPTLRYAATEIVA